MSYTPDDQLLTPSLTKIISGIEDFITASTNRLNDSCEWQANHLNELTELSIKLLRLKTELILLRKDVV